MQTNAALSSSCPSLTSFRINRPPFKGALYVTVGGGEVARWPLLVCVHSRTTGSNRSVPAMTSCCSMGEDSLVPQGKKAGLTYCHTSNVTMIQGKTFHILQRTLSTSPAYCMAPRSPLSIAINGEKVLTSAVRKEWHPGSHFDCYESVTGSIYSSALLFS